MPKLPPMSDEDAAVLGDSYAAGYEKKPVQKLAEQVLAEQVLAAYDASDRHIPDSDLDDEQPVSLLVRTTLGDIRYFRRVKAMLERGAELVAADLKAREDYDASL